MGICLSCLRSDDDNDDEFNERSSLLRDHNLYTDENLQEELLKQQQRQQELNVIVNDLNDNLIDLSTFLNSSVNNNLAGSTNLSYSTGSLQPQTTQDEIAAPDSQQKQYPYLLTSEEKQDILREVENISDDIKSSIKAESDEPLYLQF